MNQPSEKKIPGSPQDWLIHAKSDLNLARIAKNGENILPEQICFHAQQAAEKALKAVLLHRRIEFPLIHDIDALIEIANDGGISLPPEIANAGLLTPYAVEARYPGYWGEITFEDINEAISLAESIVAWANGIILQEKE
ncbi:MAG: HEPN domain-containing protein [Nitrospirota bacterium]